MKYSSTSHPLRVGMVQFKPSKADVVANLGGIAESIGAATGEVDVLLFPEACTTGYFLEGGVAEGALSAEELIAGLGTAGEGAPDVALGFYERGAGGLYNSAAYLTPEGDSWGVVHVHRKLFLPTYGVFQEARFVKTGRAVRAFDTRFGRAGFLICEEMWHSLPATILALDGAEMILVPSASPARDFSPADGRPGNVRRWRRLAAGVASEHGVFVVVSQLVGSEGGKLFAGGSVACGPDGTVLAEGPLMEEAVAVVSLAKSEVERVRAEQPLLADLEQMIPHLLREVERTLEGESAAVERERPKLAGSGPGLADGAPDPSDHSPLDLDLELVERALVEFIREEVQRRRGFEKVVVGVSGGVDSAVSLTLAVRALGPENVFGFRMPYTTSSQDSLDHARLVFESTGAVERTISISGAVDAYVEGHEPDLSPLRRGNLAARFRSLTLFDQSAKVGGLPLGTGNKSERLLGYYTWHADDSPPINPLGDLFKTQVWELARHLGVPAEVVEKPASADLVQGVHDEDELGISYAKADLILHWLLRGFSVDGLVGYGFARSDVELVWGRLSRTHWKRELPTVAVLSESAIGEFYLRPVDY